MFFPLIPLYLSSVIPSSNGFLVNDKPTCPPKEELKPCTCADYSDVTVTCTNIIEGSYLQNVFNKNRKWNIQKVHIDRAIVDFIPASVIQLKTLKTLNVSSSTLTALFEEIPEQTPEFDIFMYDVNLRRGLQWELFKKSSISGLGTFNFVIKHIGKDFKTYMPKTVKNLWFENAKTKHISHNAFQGMEGLELLTLTGGSINQLVRDWFPRPWKVRFLNFSNQKITALPENFFEDIPELVMFAIARNNLQTIDSKVFTKSGVNYALEKNPIVCNCEVKWIVTSGIQQGKMFFGTCASPESFSGKKLNRLTTKDFSHCQ